VTSLTVNSPKLLLATAARGCGWWYGKQETVQPSYHTVEVFSIP